MRKRRNRFIAVLSLLVLLSCVKLVLRHRATAPTAPTTESLKPTKVTRFLSEVARYKLSHIESIRIRQLAAVVSRYLRQHSIHHFLAFGSALGAVRHRGVIPSDDDFDMHVCCNRSKLETGPLSPARLAEVGLAWARTERFSKLFFAIPLARVDVSFKAYPWRWPFIDLFFLQNNGSHFYSEWDPVHPEDWLQIPNRLVLPADSLEFEGVRMPVMRCVRSIVDRQFPGWKDEMCLGDWDHRKEIYRGGKKMKGRMCLPTAVLKQHNISFFDVPKLPNC